SRALPDVRDGLKPVHRRILWAMHEANLRPDRNHRKCATVVGDVIGKYHPHGDSAVYDALVRMGQDFSLLHPLVDPHGNFGSPSDPPAAYRYTECRLTSLATQMLSDIDEETVDFIPNFDGSNEEPTVLPARFPNLLVNGSQGIAVGMATNIPPHNLGEVCDAIVHLIDHPDAGIDDLMEFVQGPDFPTGAHIMGRSGLLSAFRTGRGSIKLRAKCEIVEGPRGDQIVVTEIPYQTSVEQIEEKIAELVNAGVIGGIRELRNERARGNTRLVIELKRDKSGGDTSPNVVLNKLFKHTPLQTTFAVNFVALVDGVPRTLNLRDAMVHYVEHQVEVIRRRSEYRLAKAQRRAHIVEGFLKALDLIDEIIAAIRSSADRSAAIAALQADQFGFSEIQATEIVDMRLSTLTRLGRERLEEEIAQLRATIAELEAILSDDLKLRSVIKSELVELREQYAVERRTTLEPDDGDLDDEDLIEDDDVVVVLSARGYVKSLSMDSFREQGRGGRGVTGARLGDEDFIKHLVQTTNKSYLLFFTNRGRVYRLKAYRVPRGERASRGTAIVNLLQLQDGETIQSVIDARDYESAKYLMFVTAKGVVKKTLMSSYDTNLRAGLIAINLREDDELVRVLQTSGHDDVLIVTRNGKGIRFHEAAQPDLDENGQQKLDDDGTPKFKGGVREMGRNAGGVRGIRLVGDDRVVAADVVDEAKHLLTVTENGFGKRTHPSEFRTMNRGGQGVKSHVVAEKTGSVVTGLLVADEDQILMVSDTGIVIRTAVDSIRTTGRSSQGVRVMRVGEASVAAVTVVVAGDAAAEDVDLDATASSELAAIGAEPSDTE
ncbi:MAG: DNA gyrase subunit A, partial [Actinomycetes bacterium]